MPEHAPALYRILHRAMCAGLVRACHDLSEGGLAVAAAEMCIGGRLGLAVTLETDDPLTALFGESNGRFLVEVRPADAEAFESQFNEELKPFVNRIGIVTDGSRLTITTRDQELLSLPVSELVKAWNPLALRQAQGAV